MRRYAPNPILSVMSFPHVGYDLGEILLGKSGLYAGLGIEFPLNHYFARG
jgi:hypothetical protein